MQTRLVTPMPLCKAREAAGLRILRNCLPSLQQARDLIGPRPAENLPFLGIPAQSLERVLGPQCRRMASCWPRLQQNHWTSPLRIPRPFPLVVLFQTPRKAIRDSTVERVVLASQHVKNPFAGTSSLAVRALSARGSGQIPAPFWKFRFQGRIRDCPFSCGSPCPHCEMPG